MKRRSIETIFYKDTYIQTLPAEGRYLFLYLLTNEYVNIIHIYQLPNPYISLDTGLPVKTIEKYQIKFQTDDKFLFKNGWIKIINADKYEHYEGGSNELAKKKQLDLIPSHILGYFNTPVERSVDTNLTVPSNQYPITNNQYNKIEDIKEEDLQEIATRSQVPISFVKSKLEDMINWHEMKPQKNHYANYFRALFNWVKRDGLKIKQDYAKQNSDLAL